MQFRISAYASLGESGPVPFELVLDGIPDDTPLPNYGDDLELKPDLRVRVLGRTYTLNAQDRPSDIELRVVPTGATVVIFGGAREALEAAGFKETTQSAG